MTRGTWNRLTDVVRGAVDRRGDDDAEIVQLEPIIDDRAETASKQQLFRTFFDKIEIGPKVKDENGEGIEREK